MSTTYLKLSPGKFGFALGLIWALAMFLMGWVAAIWDYGTAFVDAFSTVYIGYAPTFLGGVVGALWGFVDFFIFGWLVALVYNACCRCNK